MKRAALTATALLAGALLAVIAWLLLVPWDLSEIDESGAMIEGGGEDNAGAIALVSVIVLAVGLVLAVVHQTRLHAAAVAFGGFIGWAILFGWRAGISPTAGANLFLVPLLVAVIPAAVIAPLVVRSVAQRRAPRSSIGE